MMSRVPIKNNITFKSSTYKFGALNFNIENKLPDGFKQSEYNK
jgi:hypothetical protein